MKMFKWKAIPGWLLTGLGACWNFFGIWAKIEFVLGKMSLANSFMSILSGIASSQWFPIFLIVIGFIWLYLATGPINFQCPNRMMSLREATHKLYRECEGTRASKFIRKHIEKSFKFPEEVMNVLAGHFAQTSITIYGKRAPFSKVMEIDKGKLKSMEFRDEASSLYYYGNTAPEYIDLAVKKDEVNQAIVDIIVSMEDYLNSCE